MCMASPMAQTTPSNPSPYPPAEQYALTTSNSVTADGVVHGGATVADQNAANMKAYGRSTASPNPAYPIISTGPTASGANYRM